MRLSFSDYEHIAESTIKREVKKLSEYRAKVAHVLATHDTTAPEYSLVYASDAALHDTLTDIKKQFKGLKHLVLVGIGGSSLGVEAIHNVLDVGDVKLTVLDTLAANELETLIAELNKIKKPKDVAICVVSKSGSTTETLVNAATVIEGLKKSWGEAIYSQLIFIGDAGTDFMKSGKKLGVTCILVPKIIGGRYSVATEVGLVPLALLGHDTDSFIDGFLHASDTEIESTVAEAAARIYSYIQKNYHHYNFFAFEKRLTSLGAWYRQLFAESLGKSVDRTGKPVIKGLLPTISTPVELHSIGQLYLSGFAGVYTDFVTFDDETTDFTITKQGLAKKFGRFTVQEVTTALYGGVVGAYHERKLPCKTTIFEEERAYELGLFMAMRLRETMYIAELMNLNAFDQPNVELYKQKTRTILGL
jgi:glucose-6-phosphate isomerase